MNAFHQPPIETLLHFSKLPNSSIVDTDPPLLSNVCSPLSLETTLTVQDQISHYAIQFNIPQNAVNSLLKCLRNHKCFQDFPSDCRTLLAAPANKSKQIRAVNTGIYHHFGLKSGLMRFVPLNLEKIKIVIGIDGLPLTKSSGAPFWPILACIMNKENKKVFLVGLYFGN